MRLTLVLTIMAMVGMLSVKAQVTAAEKQALKDLYDATNGPNWATETDGNISDDWDFLGNVTSAWYGVTVQDGHVVQLDLEFNQLMGTLPSSIGNLVHLTFLNLSTNALTGSIPNEIGNMVVLQTLDFASNDISGNLPLGLGNLSNLENLYLYANELIGSIPPELGNLSNLVDLRLYANHLSGNIPAELGNLLSLKWLYLNDNKLSGVIPPEIGNLSNLTQLYLGHNTLVGPIPPELGNLSSLASIYLNDNDLNGLIPPELGNLSSLVWLDFQNNNLNGALPPELENLSNIKWVYLSNNLLNGTIPTELANLSSLEWLYLDNNQFNGSIPPELGNFSSLVYLKLNNNNLTGTIPKELGNMSNLLALYLGNNELSGSIPLELGNMQHLGSLILNNNNLGGTIPPELGNFTLLEGLDLSNNNLIGSIPSELGNLSTLISLQLANNNLSGTIPPELGNTSLMFLDLSQNGLTGSIPAELTNLGLMELYLQNNELTGTIPSGFGLMTSLRKLDLSFNGFTDIIPMELGNLMNLELLHLNDNDLFGTIPPELGNPWNLHSIYLQNNRLSGDIPSTIIDQIVPPYFYVENNQFDFGNLEYTYQNADDINFGYNPQQKTDQPESLEVVEGGDIVLTTEISGTQNHYQWYKDGQPIIGALDFPNYPIIGATLEDAGTYHCVMTSDIITDLVLTRHNIDLVVTENPQADEDWNMITVWDYDLNTNLKANTRRYYDDLGKPVQTQSLDVFTSTIWGQATLYDYQGRAALSTLSAPIPGQGKFLYHTSFITNEGGESYGTPDFDIDIFTPSKVLQDGPLGKYYNGVTSDQYQDVTAFPFSRTVFSGLNPGTALAVVGGNKMDTNGDNTLTEEDEWPQAYSFTMPATDELSLEEAFSEVDYKTIQTLKTVTRDVHGNENVVFTDTDGKMLATARSGENGVLSPPIKLFIGEQGYVDVHIPKGINTGIWISNESAVTLYNLITDALEPTQASNLPPGFYRVAVNDLENYTPSTIFVRYNVNYYDYSLYEYDEVGRLVASYQPLTDENGGKLVTTYQYNTLGQLIRTTGPDQGTAEFKYRKDGQIRYSQNSEQVLVNEVSYTDYDNFGRPVESGVLVNVAFSNLDPDDPLPQVAKKETMATTYDFLEDGDYDFLGSLDADHQHPSFLTGNVAKTGNGNTTTYYSYDGYGRVKWVVEDIDGLGAKTIDYGYEPLTGLVQKVIYQKGQEDQFVHRYSYNQRDQLVQVETAVDDNDFQLQAEYIYNDAGTLVRTEIADGAQGMDYVYNLAGQLKGINHPSLNPAKDPGGDTNDLFGMQLDYHLGDYQRTENSNITTAPQGSDQFNGNIKGIRWQTSVSGAQESQYVYSYDRNNWLVGANFAPAGNTDAYDVGPIAYDANGNIQSLVRKKDPNDQNNTSMDDLTYHYDSQKPNRLLWVDDAISNVPDADDLNDQAKGNYGYNAIGQLVYDQSQEITYIYNASGLVAEVLRKGKTLVKFFYNDRNHRVRKETYDSGTLLGTTYYVRDVAGQVMAVYSDAGGSMSLAEQPIYGAGRIGIAYMGNNNTITYVYELTDHLGNVRAVFTKNGAENGQVEGYTDYYPFGMPMPNRTLSGAEGYRYAFQGLEKDPETGKEAFELRLWDSRIGRWLTTDPYGQYNSPYLGMGNNPISRIDPDGGFDWYKDKDGNYVYDSRITSQQDLTTYGIEGTYEGKTFYDFEALQTGDAQGNLFSVADGSLITSFLDGVEVGPIKYFDIYRDTQTLNSTTSTFTFEDISGFILEPKGPETIMSNQNRRIPAGVYKLVNHNSKKYPNVFKLYNDQVSQSRAILIHKGNRPDHTRGCLLPGCTRSKDRVWKSGDKLVELKNALDAENIENIRVRIHNRFPNTGIPFID